ncbi:MAG: dephospho-CoA kinase [Prevotellaceae bacterium]|jgi:dephospho-CoA kinase|nr:dephospho-CoA kinase [Prevotellaceae bacterium]
MLKIGLTGGVGNGKSLVCRIFHLFGAPVFNADLAAKRLYDTDSNLRNRIISAFGSDIYDSSNRIDRAKLAKLIFSDRDSLQKINELVHPAVINDFNRYAASLPDGTPYVIHETAILYEAKMQNMFDAIINVCAPENLKIIRAVSRGDDENDIKKRIASQLPDNFKKEAADFNIVNDDKTLILPQIVAIHNELSKSCLILRR